MSGLNYNINSALAVREGPNNAVAPVILTGLPFSDLLGDSIVRIEVGTCQSAKTFHIHKKLLCQKVQVFDRMFNGAFIEGKSQTSTLPEDCPKAFGVFVGWLYKGVVELPNALVDDEIRLFGFAEKYGVIELADKTLEYLLRQLSSNAWFPNWSQMSLAYNLTHESSKLRLLMARCAAYLVFNLNAQWEGTWCNANIRKAIQECSDLGFDALEALRLHAGKYMEDPRTRPVCDYHQHAATEPCPYRTT